MISVARKILPLSLRTMAYTALVHSLLFSRFIDKLSPTLGLWSRRAILSLWWNVTVRFRLWLRRARDPAPARQTGASPWPDLAPEDIVLPLAEAPAVSVIIPTYGQIAHTLRCLASIAAHLPEAPIEIIVVDDAFPGGEVSALARVRGIRLLRNETNLGFIRSCNAAARAARGEFLFFLNNDTEVRAGWLDQSRAVFERRADAGLVGSKLLSGDGTLQEAGGIIWNDGSGWNHGRGRDPDAAAFNYAREVDYCSGAALMVRRAVFLGVDGFDEAYAPAYCEDSDLSFRLRQQGLKTYYQPRSEIVHFEGVSNGRDLRHGVKAYQTVNQARFLRTWQDELTRNHFPNGAHVLRAGDRARSKPVVLIADHLVPEPDRDAGSRTMVAFMRALLDAGCVVKFWPFNLHPTPGYTQALQDMGIEVFHGPRQAQFPEWLRHNGADLDLVLLSRPDVADVLLPLTRLGTKAKVAYYGHDLHFRRMRSQADLSQDMGQIRASEVMRAREMAIWRNAELVQYPSEEEAAMVRALVPAATVHAVVPYALGVPDALGVPKRRDARNPPAGKTILFVAGFGHPPNAEAALWFAREVLPLVLAREPTARLMIVGSNPLPSILALPGPSISLFANVTDAVLAGFYDEARAAVVPLLAGAGVKRKTVEALWHGLPLVVTPVGAQGLPGLDAIVPVETRPDAFAAAVCDVLEDDALWRRQSLAQSVYAQSRFSDAALGESLRRALGLEEPAPVAQACASTVVMA